MNIFSREKEKSFFDQAKEEELNAMKLLASKQLVEMNNLKRKIDDLTTGKERLYGRMIDKVGNFRLRIKVANRAIQNDVENSEELTGLIKGYKLAIDEMAGFIDMIEKDS